MARIIVVVVALVLLSSCGNYTLIDAKRRDINTFYSVHPQIEWNALRTSNFEVWTVDGVDLAAIYFVKGLTEGETLFEPKRGTEAKEWPSFRKYMKGSEVAELVVDSMSSAGLSFVESSGLRPAQFGERVGFRFWNTAAQSWQPVSEHLVLDSGDIHGKADALVRLTLDAKPLAKGLILSRDSMRLIVLPQLLGTHKVQRSTDLIRWEEFPMTEEEWETGLTIDPDQSHEFYRLIKR